MEDILSRKGAKVIKTPGKSLLLCFLASLREIKYLVAAAKNYGRKMLILEEQLL